MNKTVLGTSRIASVLNLRKPKHRYFSVFALILIIVFLFSSFASRQKSENSNRTERYLISSKEYPNFKEVVLNPFDFNPGEEQVVYVKLENPNPIEKVSAVVMTDSFVKTYELKLLEGNGTKGTWRGVWKIDDTRNYTYRETFKAVSGSDKSKIELYFK